MVEVGQLRKLYTEQKNNYFRIGLNALMAFSERMQLKWIGAGQGCCH